MCVVHRCEPERSEHEGKSQREIVGVVHRAEEHGKNHRAECDAQSSRQNVDAPMRQDQWIGIAAMALAHPGSQSILQGSREGAEHAASGSTCPELHHVYGFQNQLTDLFR